MADKKKAVKDKEEKNIKAAAKDEAKEAKDSAAKAAEDVESKESASEAEKSDKKSDKKSKEDPRDAKIKELEEARLRQLAEFENFRSRSEKEKNEMFSMGAISIVEKILPVIDNFERGFQTLTEDQKKDGFVVGMDKIYQQMLTELSGVGVVPIECVGKEMDPNYFNAVMQVESDEYESGVVAQELQKGYVYKKGDVERVIRHSMVAVVQ